MFVLGLTGSIGMGKSTTASMFREAGVPVHDADAAVHRLYAGDAVESVGQAFPGTVADGRIDRAALSARVLNDPEAMARLESLVHPLVRREETRFLDAMAKRQPSAPPLVVLDIPLLFETGAEARCDAIVVITAPDAVQRARVLARPGMTEEKLAAILSRQMPDAEKRRRAHFLVDTGHGLDSARAQVASILRAVAGRGRARRA